MTPARSLAMRLLATLALIATFVARPATAGIELAGTTGANFLTLGPGASMFGMAGSGLGASVDLSSMSWNAASLGLLNDSQLMFTHMPLAGSASQEWMAFGGHMGETTTRWALTGRYEGDGSFEARDPLGNPTGTFNASSLALGVNAAKSFDPRITLGFGAKFVNENLGAVSGYGGTFDMGMLLRTGSIGIGLAAQNLGGSIKYDTLAYSMPMNLGVGISLASASSGLRLNLDMNHPAAYYNDVRLGAEWAIHGRVTLRAGYRHELNAPSNDPMNGTTFGIGLGNHGLWVDYGYMAGPNGGSEQRVSLRVSPKDWGMPFVETEARPSGGSESTQPVQAPRAAAQAPAPVPVATVIAPDTVAAAPAPAPAPKKTTKVAPTMPAATLSAPISTPSTAAAPALAAPVIAPAPPPPAPVLTALVPSTAPAAPAPKTVPKKSPTAPTLSAPAQATKPVPLPEPVAEVAPKTPPQELPAQTKAVEPSAPAPAETQELTPEVSGPPTPPPAAEVVPAPIKSAPPIVAPVKPAKTPPPAPATKPAKAEPRPDKIHVQKGETLETIAKKYNTTVAAIMMENNLVKEKIHPGQTLKIPDHQ